LPLQQRRLSGKITCYYPEKKYGFIRSETIWRTHRKDVLALASQIGAIGVGSVVTFNVTVQTGGLRADNVRAEVHTGIPAQASFVGIFVAYYPSREYGFIRCSELVCRFGCVAKSILALRSDVSSLDMGDCVTFNVIRKADGRLRATAIKLVPDCDVAGAGDIHIVNATSRLIGTQSYSRAATTIAQGAGFQVLPALPEAWAALNTERHKQYFIDLELFLMTESRMHVVCPAMSDVFRALERCPLDSVRMVILCQDPAPSPGKATGLALGGNFVGENDSLSHIMAESECCGFARAAGLPDISLRTWASQGVLLLNVALTVRAGEPCSHMCAGWTKFIIAIFRLLQNRHQFLVFLLMGRFAKRFDACICQPHHVLRSIHPVMWAPHRGLALFTAVNDALRSRGQDLIDFII
jgi:uracil-DNA glycosylase